MTQSARQDPVKVDPSHYKVEHEDEHVRVLRIRYGPREKSPMHWHPAVVATFLTDLNGRFTMPDGTTQDITVKAGEVMAMPAGDHAPENLGDRAFELVVVELKGTT